MNVIISTSSSRDKGKAAVKKTRPTPKNNDQTVVISTAVTSDIDDEIVDEKPIAAVPSEAQNTSNANKSLLRYMYKCDAQIWHLASSLDAPSQFNSFPAD
jgi:hypothetical protein